MTPLWQGFAQAFCTLHQIGQIGVAGMRADRLRNQIVTKTL